MDCQQTDTHNDDFIVNGKLIDVKAKYRNVEARPNYEASVWEFSLGHQRPDFFVFTSQYKDILVELVGYLSFDEFMDRSRFMKKGEDQGNMKIVENCRNVYHSQLHSMDTFFSKVSV